ncbi:hypothetical protein CSUNSWCD_1215 [Campylobacter showae CSUNSWCD]|uniref:Lipoprotein n=1 Tax=Campylobacter showae CSUNSWCD TaxID=1244083 RepID=M5IRL3_9BACT|nr:hypothetical protein CSUNSWCD_1215 [Campylobacter showae CSUNSWCD]
MQLQKASKAKQYKRHGGGCFLFFLSFAGCANGFYRVKGGFLEVSANREPLKSCSYTLDLVKNGSLQCPQIKAKSRARKNRLYARR